MQHKNTNKDFRLARQIKLAGSDNWVAQRDAAQRLGDLKNPEAVPVLIELLSHKIIPIRIVAIGSLSKLGDRRALPGLRLGLESPFEKVREAAMEALCSFPDIENLELLAPGLFDQEKCVREKALTTFRKHLEGNRHI